MNVDAVLQFARELYGGKIEAEIKGDGDDWFNFQIGANNVLQIEAGSSRGALYAVYGALKGEASGRQRPEFAIRGLNPCESLNRHTPEQLTTLIDRMGRWRMNTLIVHSNYGFCNFKDLILKETRKRGIDVVHYTYSNLCFMNDIAPEYFARNDGGAPMQDSLQCETRLCVGNPEGLRQYGRNILKYLTEHPDYGRMIFCTADGLELCRCPACRDRGAIAQWHAIFDPFFDAAHNDRKLEMLSYVQRFSVPEDMSRVSRLERVLFDTHLRYARTPLGSTHEWMKQGSRFGYPPDLDPIQDVRGDQPINTYLWDRLAEWRKAFKGRLYVFENLMIQGIWGCPRPNTSIYLEDLRNFKKLGLDGVVYECFEPGIEPFLPTFDAIAQTLWNLEHPYEKSAFEKAYLAEGATDEDFRTSYAGHEKWISWRGEYPRSELARLLYKDHFQPSVNGCREALGYVLENPRRDDFDWLYIAHGLLKKAYGLGTLGPVDERERIFLTLKKLWDFQERCVSPRQEAIEVIFSLWKKFKK